MGYPRTNYFYWKHSSNEFPGNFYSKWNIHNCNQSNIGGELEIDGKAMIWARVSRKQKISILVLSSAMGSNLREILDNVCYPEIFMAFLNEKEEKK